MLRWLPCAGFYPLCLFLTRSPAGCQSRKRIHFRHVCESQSQREKNHLLPLHLCHRHRQHSICLPCGEGPHPAWEPGSLQPGLNRWASPSLIQSALCSWRPGELCSDSVCLTLLLNTIIQNRKLRCYSTLSPNDRTTDVFQIFLLGSLKMDVSSYNEVCPDN